MSRYRVLRGIARNVAHKFSVSCEHFAYLALKHRVVLVEIDLHSRIIFPAEFRVRRNEILVGYVADRLPHLLQADHVPTGKVTGALLRIRFLPDEIRQGVRVNLFYIPTCVEVEFTDDRGRQHVGQVEQDSFMCE